MGDRDWEKELAKIDRHIAALPEDEPAPPPARGAPPPARAPAAAPPAGAGAAAPAKPPSRIMLWVRVLVAVALGAGVLFWPYDARCGAGLAGLLAVIALVVLSGLWASVWTWRHRAARLHVLSLAIVLWGLLLAAREVLPRTPYGVPTLERPATWVCQ